MRRTPPKVEQARCLQSWLDFYRNLVQGLRAAWPVFRLRTAAFPLRRRRAALVGRQAHHLPTSLPSQLSPLQYVVRIVERRVHIQSATPIAFSSHIERHCY